MVVFTFTILDEDQTGSARGNQLYSNNQNHNNDCLKITYNLEVFRLGDRAASSDRVCIWCKKDKRGDIQRVWSLSDRGARTIDENAELANDLVLIKHTMYHVDLFSKISLSRML